MEEGREDGRAERAMMVGYVQSERVGESSERKKERWSDVRLESREKPQVGVGGLGSGKKGDEGTGGVNDFDRGGGENGNVMGAE